MHLNAVQGDGQVVTYKVNNLVVIAGSYALLMLGRTYYILGPVH